MTQQKSSPPTVQEMGVRIFSNIRRVKNYLEILRSEIADPQKIGPGSTREEWLEATNSLNSSIDELEQLLKSQKWIQTDE